MSEQMLRAVFDTNVLISGVVFAGRSRLLINAVLEGKLSLVLSKQIIREFRGVTARDQFKLTRNQQNTLINFVFRLGDIIEIKSNFRVVKEDPSDNIILRTAYDGKANYIVSGDGHLLALKEFKGIKIITVNEMLALLK